MRMRAILQHFVDGVDKLTETFGRAVSWLTVLLVLVVFANVLMRYLLGHSLLALQDLSWHLFGAIFFLAAGYTLKHERHVRVDLIYSTLSNRTCLWIDLVGFSGLALFFCAVGVWTSIDFVAYAYEIGESSPDPGGLPARYIPKGLIPVGFSLLLIQVTAEVLRRVVWLLDGKKQ